MTLSAAELELCHLSVCVTAGIAPTDSIDVSTRRALLPLLKRLTTEAAEVARSRRRDVDEINDNAQELDRPAEMPAPRLIEPITVAQAATILGKSRRQVQRKAQAGVLEAKKFSNNYLFERITVLTYKERNP